MQSRSCCLVKSMHMIVKCRQVAGSCTSSSRLHVSVDVALHVNSADEVLSWDRTPCRLYVLSVRVDPALRSFGVFSTPVPLIRQPSFQEVVSTSGSSHLKNFTLRSESEVPSPVSFSGTILQG